MTKRHEWTFRYTATVVAAAAEEKAAYHREREAYWRDEEIKAKDAIDHAGVEVRSQEVTGGFQHQVVLDPALAAPLNTAASKIQTHRKEAEQYEEWAAVLGDQPTFTDLDLDWTDVIYFGLGKDTKPESQASSP